MWKKLFNRPKESSARGAADEIMTCQDDLVRAVADSITDLHDGEWENREWLRIVVNHEALWAQSAPRTSSLGFVIARRLGGPLEKLGFRLSPAARHGFQKLAALMQARDGRWWTVCHLVIERDGRFDFAFSHDKPYRIDGELNDRRFADYLEKYRAETGRHGS